MIKQVIVIRTDLNMRKGKMAAQAAHAGSEIFRLNSTNWVRSPGAAFQDSFLGKGTWSATLSLTDMERQWLLCDRRRIVLGCRDEAHMMDICHDAVAAGLRVYAHRDAGFTDVAPDTLTALAIGPDLDVKIDAVTGSLKLL